MARKLALILAFIVILTMVMMTTPSQSAQQTEHQLKQSKQHGAASRMYDPLHITSRLVLYSIPAAISNNASAGPPDDHPIQYRHYDKVAATTGTPPTTTTAPPPTTTTQPPAPAPHPAVASAPSDPPEAYSGYPDPIGVYHMAISIGAPYQVANMLACIAWNESRDEPGIVNSEGYAGLFQFSMTRWASSGGTGYPASSSPLYQTEIAYRTYQEAGWAPWRGDVCVGW